MSDDQNVVALAWYTPVTFRELAALPEAEIEISYAEYLRKNEELIAHFSPKGFRVVKVAIDIRQMTMWCHQHGYEIDGAGRAIFSGKKTAACDV